MLTISTETKKLYINTNLLKSRLKKAVISILKLSTFICGFSGAIIVLKGAGLHENDVITFNQALLLILQGFFLCGIAYVLNFIKLVIE